MWVLLGAAVIASLATLAIALRDADRPLPAAYHWEGEHLDRDFALARARGARHRSDPRDRAPPAMLRDAAQCAGDPPALSLLLFATASTQASIACCG